MEQMKIILSEKDGKFGKYFTKKVEIDGKNYYLNVYPDVQKGQYGNFIKATIKPIADEQPKTVQATSWEEFNEFGSM